jgi:hypothetical protein
MREGLSATSKVEELKGAVPMPESVFKTWRNANIAFPQEGVGIIIEVASAIMQENISPSDIARMELTTKQLDVLMKMMYTAHSAKGIFPRGSEDDEHMRRQIKSLWFGFQFRILNFFTNYVSLATKGHRPLVSFYNQLGDEELLRTCGEITSSGFLQNSLYKDELIKILQAAQKVLHSEEVLEIEAERRDLLDNKKYGTVSNNFFMQIAPSNMRRKRQLKKVRKLTTEVSTHIFLALVQLSKQEKFSVDFSSITKVVRLFSGRENVFEP